MVVVGLTGGIGSGKTTVLQLFGKLGVACYIADAEAKKLMNSSSEIRKEIIKEFGIESYTTKGLNRKHLAEIVFRNPKKLKTLNKIVHPQVHKDFKRFIQNTTSDYVIYESAILFENKSENLCDIIITVTAPIPTRIDRILLRDGTTKTAILDRMKNQLPDEKKISKSDFVIENIDLKTTQEVVNKIHNEILQINKSSNK